MAVSRALRHQTGVSEATREQILHIARDLGYAPDARLASWMTQVRASSSKDLLPIAWLNTCNEKDSWHRYPFHAPSLEGSRERALELGYKIEEIWCCEPGLTMRRLKNIIYRRGIEGVIVTQPARHLRLDWGRLAGVSLGGTLMAPRLHSITQDFIFNLKLALKSLKRLGYRRIGLCIQHEVGSGSSSNMRASMLDVYSRELSIEEIPPLLYPPWWKSVSPEGKYVEGRFKQTATLSWLKRYKPEVVVGFDNRLEQWVKAAGFRVPEDIGIVHLARDDDVLDWAGINSHRRVMGATAVEWLVSLIRNRQFGVPKHPVSILIRGSWQSGWTLGGSPSAKAKTVPKRRTAKKEL